MFFKTENLVFNPVRALQTADKTLDNVIDLATLSLLMY